MTKRIKSEKANGIFYRFSRPGGSEGAPGLRMTGGVPGEGRRSNGSQDDGGLGRRILVGIILSRFSRFSDEFQ
jgi:hypothetical protein